MATKSPPILLSRVINIDKSFSLYIHTKFLPIPRFLLKTLEISGDGRFFLPIPISLFSFSPRSPILLALILGLFLDLLLVGLIKQIVRRSRPIYNNGMHLTFSVDHWSFPSGHSSRVFFVAAFLNMRAADVYGYFGGEFADVFLMLVCVWSVATSASRVLLGRHFVLDVIAGACLGWFEALLVFRLMEVWWDWRAESTRVLS